MNLDMTWTGLARAAGGRLLKGGPEDPVESLSTDTRSLREGQAFWALKGPRFDAHDLLDTPAARKASGWIVSRLPEGGLAPEHVVLVPDGLKALQALAASHRRRFDIPVAGITGSNGKTTTKEMLKSICLRVGPTCSTPGNWNNQLGVPLSVLELRAEHRYGVFELADSHPGDIDEVARVAQPTIGVLTNIGPDHLEFYGSMEANFKTKSELIDRLPEDGRAVINIDDPWLAGLETRLGARAVTYGFDPRAKICFVGKDELDLDRHRIKVRLSAIGALSRYNAAAAAAAAWAMGIPPEAIRLGLEDYRPGLWRLEPMRHDSGCDILFDAYNANPASMKASIEAFCEEFAGKEKVLVLGDMKELGTGSEGFHSELGAWLSGLPLRAVYLAGPEMEAARRALKDARFPVAHGASAEPWLDALRGECASGRALFFKASRSMRFEDILKELRCSTI